MDPERQREIASKGGQARGQQLHEQAELRHKLEQAGYPEEAESVKPQVGFAAMDPEVRDSPAIEFVFLASLTSVAEMSVREQKQHEIASKGGQTRGAQLHEQAERRHALQDAGYPEEAESVKPKVGFAAMDPEVRAVVTLLSLQFLDADPKIPFIPG
jgi:general stress protein YciG